LALLAFGAFVLKAGAPFSFLAFRLCVGFIAAWMRKPRDSGA
jgi:hypothetical protein